MEAIARAAGDGGREGGVADASFPRSAPRLPSHPRPNPSGASWPSLYFCFPPLVFPTRLTKEDDNEDREGLIKTQPFSVQDAAKSMLKGAHPLAAGAAWLNAGWLKDPPTPPQVAGKWMSMRST